MLREVQYEKALRLFSKGTGEVPPPPVMAGLQTLPVRTVPEREFLSDRELAKANDPEPRGPLGTSLAFATDGRGPRGSLGLPIPVLREWIPVDFLLGADPRAVSFVPRVGTFERKGEKPGLFR
jgi:hypothetical protein